MDTLLTKTQAKVAEVLTSRFADHIDFGDGTFAIPHGSSSVSVVVRSYTETDTVVELTAQLATDSNVDTDLMHWLLRKNAELHMGGFALLFDNTIVFTYSISGATFDGDSLEAAITSVAVIADHYDDEIVSMAGGKRVVDF